MKQIPSIVIALSLLILTHEALSQTPSCTNVKGVWHNAFQTPSILTISSLNPSTGEIKGTYASGSYSGTLTGWINDETTAGSGRNKVDKVISFTVKWDVGSITSWTGYCITVNNASVIEAQWHLVRPRSNEKWDHILAGNDVFNPR